MAAGSGESARRRSERSLIDVLRTGALLAVGVEGATSKYSSSRSSRTLRVGVGVVAAGGEDGQVS